MGKKGLTPGNTQLSISIKETTLQLLKNHGVTDRKRGEKIEELILKEYAGKVEDCTPDPVQHT